MPAFGLIGEKGINPPLLFFMTVHTKLVRTTDGSVLHEQKLIYSRPGPTFTAWTVNGGKLFRDEFYRCYQSLAEKVVEEIFLLCNLSLNSAPQVGSGG